MSLGNQNQNTGKLFVLKVVTHDAEKKKLDHPTFEVKEKNDQGQWVITKNVPAVSGRLAKVTVKEGEWEGDKFYTVSTLIKDDTAEESYLVDFKFNLMNRSVFNSLLNIDTTKDIKIGLYTSKKGYPAASVRQGDEMINWKYSLDEQPKAEEITFKGKTMRDYTATDTFFVNKLREFGASLGSTHAPAPVSQPESKSTPSKPKKEKVVKKQELVEAPAGGDLPDEGDLF